MTLSLIAFKGEHLDMIEGDAVFKQNKEDLKIYEGIGIGYTLVDDGKVVCCAGVIDAANGVADCWMVAGEIESYAKTVVKTIKQFFAMMSPFYHRFQMLVRCDNETAIRFANHFDFETEGKLRKFDGNNDYWMMSWLH